MSILRLILNLPIIFQYIYPGVAAYNEIKHTFDMKGEKKHIYRLFGNFIKYDIAHRQNTHFHTNIIMLSNLTLLNEIVFWWMGVHDRLVIWGGLKKGVNCACIYQTTVIMSCVSCHLSCFGRVEITSLKPKTLCVFLNAL